MNKSEYNRKYYQDHLEQEKARKLAWYYDNKETLDKEALKEYHKSYYQANKASWNKRTPEQRAKINAARRERYASDPEYNAQTRAKVKEYQTSHPHVRKAQRIKKFGITLDEFNQLLEAQSGKCAICGYSDRSDSNFFPVVDHDHATGKVRGLLCMNCNTAIGKFKDDINIIKSAINYLVG